MPAGRRRLLLALLQAGASGAPAGRFGRTVYAPDTEGGKGAYIAASRGGERRSISAAKIGRALRETDPHDLTAARAAWEKRHGARWPARSFGATEIHCPHQPAPRPEKRKEWTNRLLGVWSANTIEPRPATLRGLEVGACSMPTSFPSNVEVTYVDFTADKQLLEFHCGRGNGRMRTAEHIVADAQVRTNVPTARAYCRDRTEAGPRQPRTGAHARGPAFADGAGVRQRRGRQLRLRRRSFERSSSS